MTKSVFEDTLSPEEESPVSDEFVEGEEDLVSEWREEVPQCLKKPRNDDGMVSWLRDEEGTLISLERRVDQRVRPNSPRVVTLRGPLRRKRKNLSTEEQQQRVSKTAVADKRVAGRLGHANPAACGGGASTVGSRPNDQQMTPGASTAKRTEAAAAAAAVIPARFRRVPRFVGVARRVNWPVFSLIVTSFFDRQRWPAFSALPRAFQNFCGGARVGPEDADDDLPGFAPEWLFHLREMDDRLFWATVDRFFAEKRFPAWQQLPAEYTAWLRTLNVREFDYPASESVPDGATKPSDAYMDRRLMLTKKEGPKNRKSFPLTEDLIRGVMHSLKFE